MAFNFKTCISSDNDVNSSFGNISHNTFFESQETLERDPGVDGVSVLHLLVLARRHVPLLAEPEAVVEPGQQIQTVLHPGPVTQRAEKVRI